MGQNSYAGGRREEKSVQLINVMASSLDGYISRGAGDTDTRRRQEGFSGPADQTHVEEQIRQADAIIVGAESIRVAGGLWLVEGYKANPQQRGPLWCVLTRKASADLLALRGFDLLPYWLVAKEAGPLPSQHQPTRTKLYGDEGPARYLYRELESHGCQRVLLFGGGHINTMFYAENLVDTLLLTLCPMLVGDEKAAKLVVPTLPSPTQMSLVASHSEASLVFLEYTVQKVE